MRIFHIPCLEDNYAYLIVDEKTGEAAVVDPVEPEKILQAAGAAGANLKLVLTTHHHWFCDHPSFCSISLGIFQFLWFFLLIV